VRAKLCQAQLQRLNFASTILVLQDMDGSCRSVSEFMTVAFLHHWRPSGACNYFSLGGSIDGNVDGALVTASIFQGTGKVAILGNGDLSVTCKVNPSTDKKVATADQLFSVLIGCLNGESIVDTPNGPRRVSQVSVGDKVLAQNPNTGALVYDDVIFTPHKNADRLTLYQDIQVSVAAAQESRRLQVTASHYVPVGEGGKAFKLARDVQVCFATNHFNDKQ
jgi:hypothetical protein